MKLLCFILVIHAAYGQVGFGRSYLRNSRLCHEWSCLNNKLGLPDSLPLKEEFSRVLNGLIKEDRWQITIQEALETCYHNRSRRYTNTCPGQALMHCVVDQMNNNCPDEFTRRYDACAPIHSLAGAKVMFTQSRYIDLESNIDKEVRPAWFLRNYFNKKCCNLPEIFSPALLNECGFNNTISYYDHKLNSDKRFTPQIATTQANDEINKVNTEPTSSVDPIDCCDMSELIAPEWRHECDFKTTWQDQDRLVIERDLTTTEPPTTTTESSAHKDMVIVPHSCEKETCIFGKLNITTLEGINYDLFTKFLDNLTNSNPVWSKAKARVTTICLTKPLKEYYDADCEINRLLACTFDVLTENCPFTKHNSCKHSKAGKTCQVSSSKYRPKKRRDMCLLPELQNESLLNILSECGVNSVSNVEMVAQNTQTRSKKNNWFYKIKCQDLSPSTSCLLDKMGTLNKYGFIDYFNMKNRIRHLTSHQEWSHLTEVYLSAFDNMPFYGQHCNSAKKILNVVDAVLISCPNSKRKKTAECNNFYARTVLSYNGTDDAQLDKVLKHYHYVYFPSTQLPQPTKMVKIVQKPIFNYGLLNSGEAPPVQLIDVKPRTERAPLVLRPVYMRYPNSSPSFNPNYGLLRNSMLKTPLNPISTTEADSTMPISTTERISTKTDSNANKYKLKIVDF